MTSLSKKKNEQIKPIKADLNLLIVKQKAIQILKNQNLLLLGNKTKPEKLNA